MVYKDYLQLQKILGAQERESGRDGTPAHHDEHFFIIVHQVYELWFKAIIFELKSVMETLKEEKVDFVKINRVNEKVTRVVEIQKILVDQLLLLDTLNPAEFMGFRGYLFPASGFQSYQFRIFENTFGLAKSDRSEFGCQHYRQDHPKEITDMIDKSESEPSLVMVVESWLEKVFDQEPQATEFWAKFEKGVKEQIEDINKKFDDDVKDKDVAMKEKRASAGAVWSSIIDKTIHKEKQEKGERKMSFKAWQGAIMITYLRNRKEKYAQAYRFINLIRDADNMFMRWRANHVLMVHRQIGQKSGTAGTTSGLTYLKSTNSDQYRIFRDLFDFHGFLLDPKYFPDYYDE